MYARKSSKSGSEWRNEGNAALSTQRATLSNKDRGGRRTRVDVDAKSNSTSADASDMCELVLEHDSKKCARRAEDCRRAACDSARSVDEWGVGDTL